MVLSVNVKLLLVQIAMEKPARVRYNVFADDPHQNSGNLQITDF